MIKKKIGTTAGLILGFSLVLAGCGTTADTATTTQSEVQQSEAEQTQTDQSDLNQANHLTIGTIGNTNLIINTDRLYGFVQEAVGDDVEVSYEVFQSGAEVLTALQAGSIDVVAGNGALPIATFGANDAEFIIIASYLTEGDSYIAARADSGITSLEDLKGQKIGVALGTGSHYLILNKLAEAGLSPEDVELVNLSGPDINTAFIGGEIDVFVNSVMLAQSLVNDGSATVVDSSDAGYYYVEANVDYAAQNPELVSEFILGLHNASAYLDENADAVIQNISETYEIETETLEMLKQFNTDTTFFLDEDGPKEQVEGYKNFALENDLISNDFDVDKYFDFSFTDRAKELASE